MNLAWNCKTHFSLLKAFSKCDELAKKCKEYGYTSCVLSDIKTMSGAIDFHQSCTKNGIKPIIGCDFEDFMLIAKNKNGWFDLISCVSNMSLDNIKNIAKNNNLFCVSLNDALKKTFASNYIKYDHKKYPVYYVNKSDADCHRILLCSGMKTTLPKINQKLRLKEDFENKAFFISDEFFLKNTDELKLNKEDIKTFEKIEQECEQYDISSKPNLPKFSCPSGLSEDDYIRQLCRAGWKSLLIASGKVNNETKKKEYADRIKHELDVILRANLSGYFLIVMDIVNKVRSMGWLAGPGRGCFLADTRVKMSSGLMKNISDIKIGDKVVDCEGKEQRVYDTLIYNVEEEILELWFGEIVIRCTKDHKFLTTNRGWVEAQYLTEKDDILEV